MSESNEAYELAESAAGYAGNLFRAMEKTVEDLRGDRAREGLQSLANVIEGLEWLLQAVTALNNASATPIFADEALKGFLKEMVGASENMDYVLLADLIEYEILPIIDEWGNKLDAILEKE